MQKCRMQNAEIVGSIRELTGNVAGITDEDNTLMLCECGTMCIPTEDRCPECGQALNWAVRCGLA